MASPRPTPLNFLPGIQRDGTQLDADRYLDGLWCRWRNGRPRKIGGYVRMTDMLLGVPRKIYPFYRDGITYLHVGTSKGLQQVVINATGTVIAVNDRTPSTFSGGPDVGWTIDAVFDTATDVVQVIAHAVPDLEALSSSTGYPVFYGQIDGNIPLTPIVNASSPSVAGGICAVQPYIFDFDSDGLVQWSQPNEVATLGLLTGGAGEVRISAQKIVAGMALRGGGAQSPSALFWSISELIGATFVGGAPIFAFNTISPSSSILSGESVVEYDSLYFWAGVDRFLVYNGTVQEVPNMQNADFFFDNLTPGFEAKTFAFKVPRYGEIWFCAPLFGATEPSHAVIFNVRENNWYDTVLPQGGRSCGYYAQGPNRPFMGGVVPSSNGYKLFRHETGVDSVDGTSTTAVRSYFETGYLTGLKNTAPDGHALRVATIEPDIIQSGDMTVQAFGRINARAPDIAGPALPLKANPAVADMCPNFKEQRRLLRLHFESNVIGGNYITGRSMAHLEPTDDRWLP